MPHFTTWNSDFYDYHGTCDLVLLSPVRLTELSTDTALQANNYRYSADQVSMNP